MRRGLRRALPTFLGRAGLPSQRLFSAASAVAEITTDTTPNPNSLKFLPGQDVMGTVGTANFPSVESAGGSRFAVSLFDIDFGIHRQSPSILQQV